MGFLEKISQFFAGKNRDSDDTAPSSYRENMVRNQLKNRGIRNERVLNAMRSVPRHRFVPDQPVEAAYSDRPLPIGAGQTISQPYMVARMTELLKPDSGASVLEIGTGSGYQTAILAELCDHVFTVERHEDLLKRARTILGEIGYENISYRVGDGTLGWEEHSPYNRILVTAGAPEIPSSLRSQLSDSSGILVIPAGESRSQELIRLTRDDGEENREKLGRCVFVDLVGEEGW